MNSASAGADKTDILPGLFPSRLSASPATQRNRLDPLARSGGWQSAEQLAGVSPYLSSWQKRGLDLTVAVMALLVLAPLLLCVALLVASTSRGPILFRQRRGGRDGVPFKVCKFRSMRVDRCSDGTEVVQATRNDPRVTPIGAFLRRSSVDELPQLLNVITGEMSLVGPRPHALAHDRFFSQRLARYPRRAAARPGITGLAQIRGARGETPRLQDMARRVNCDIHYVRNASLALDVAILAATAREMLFSKTAY